MCEINESPKHPKVWSNPLEELFPTPIDNDKLLSCPRCQGLFFYNPDTSEILKMRCKTYACPYCGGKKAKSLELGIIKFLSNWKHIRLFTFTYRTGIFKELSFQEINKKSSEIWHYFITYLRRYPALNKLQKQFDYIRVVEFTKKEFPHFHVFISQYLPWQVVQACWNSAINTVFESSGKNGHVDIKHSHNATSAGRYVVKYVMKAVREFPIGRSFRLYSKSSKVTLFETFKSSGKFYLLNCIHSQLDLSIIRVTAQHEFNLIMKEVENSLSEIINNGITSDSS